jgi:cytochrome c553
MRKREQVKAGLLVVFMASGLFFYRGAEAQDGPKHRPAPGDGKSMVVQLCDGETNLTVPGVRPGERLSPEQAQAVSDKLMELWMAKQDPKVAEAWRREASAYQQRQPGAPSPAGQGAKPETAAQEKKEGQQQSTSRGPVIQPKEQVIDFTARDYLIWDRELSREIAYGDKIFHDDKLIGSTNGVACAMCHPNAANTHPETYPKFQVQLRKVALLRDMINWCIENPSRGKRLDPDDPKMRALEAYIMAQRKGVPMEYGKH